MSPGSLHAKWSFEAEIVPLVSFCDETRKETPFLLVFFTLMIMAIRKKYILGTKTDNFLMCNFRKSPY